MEVHPPQTLGQPSFFYYNPDTRAENKQHGHFSPHPNAVQDGTSAQQIQFQGFQQQIMQGQPRTMCHRPSSSGSHVYLQPKPHAPMQPMLTPLASPRPLHQKPSFLCQTDNQQLYLDTDCNMNSSDFFVHPATPPLSVTSSTASSPPSTCGVLSTPVSVPFFALENIEGVKEGCESEVKSEILAGGDWTRSYSPPLTPGTCFLFPIPEVWSDRYWLQDDIYRTMEVRNLI